MKLSLIKMHLKSDKLSVVTNRIKLQVIFKNKYSR